MAPHRMYLREGANMWTLAARQATLIHFARRDRVSVPDIGPRDRVLASTIAGGCSGATAAALFRKLIS